MSDDTLEIPVFLRRSNTKENTMAKAKTDIEVLEPTDEERGETPVSNEKEVRPTKAQFLEAANEIDEIDEQIEAIHAKVAAEIEGLNDKRNKSSEVVRKYLGRKR